MYSLVHDDEKSLELSMRTPVPGITGPLAKVPRWFCLPYTLSGPSWTVESLSHKSTVLDMCCAGEAMRIPLSRE